MVKPIGSISHKYDNYFWCPNSFPLYGIQNLFNIVSVLPEASSLGSIYSSNQSTTQFFSYWPQGRERGCADILHIVGS